MSYSLLGARKEISSEQGSWERLITILSKMYAKRETNHLVKRQTSTCNAIPAAADINPQQHKFYLYDNTGWKFSQRM